MVYGYMRVSSRDQCEDRQAIALRDAGVEEDAIYLDKQSGSTFDRPAYKRLLRRLKPGDVLIIKSIDRLGRNYTEILDQWRIITKKKQAAIVVLDMPLLDTRQSHDLTGTLIADIVLQLLSYVAETERVFTKQRQAEGIAAAHSRGVRFGRKFKPIPDAYPDVLAQWQRRELSEVKAARVLGISPYTFKAWRAKSFDELIEQRAGWCVE